MDIWLITDGGVERKPAEELDLLIAMQEGLVWVDIPTCDSHQESPPPNDYYSRNVYRTTRPGCATGH